MLRTARLTEALHGRGKTLAASLGAVAVLAGAGSASAVLTSGASPANYHPAGIQAAPVSAHAATPVVATHAATPFTVTHPVAAPANAATSLVATHAATPFTVTHQAATPAHFAAATLAASKPGPQPARAQSQHAAPAPQPAPAQSQLAAPAPQPAPAQTQQPAPAPAPAQPYQVYDSTTPSAIPAGQPAAVYSNGAYAAPASQVAGHGNVLWIDTNGSNPQANALDVEPGDATPQQAATWVWQKLHSNGNQTAIVYTMRSDWQATQAAIATLPAQMQSHVKWWIADPTGVPHMVPGADATQWYWGQNYDISLANPGF